MTNRYLSILLTCAIATAQAPLPTDLPNGWRRTGGAVVGAPRRSSSAAATSGSADETGSRS